MAKINIGDFMTWEENGEYDCKISYIKDDVKQLSLKQIPIINELIKNRLNHDNFMTAETIWNIVVSNYDKKRFKINEDYSPEGVKAHLKRLKKEKYWKDVIVSQYDYKKYNKEGANAGYKIEFDVLKLDSAAKEKIRDYVSEAESSKLLNSNVFKEQDNVPVNGSTQKPKENKRIMSIVSDDGTSEEVEVILAFEFKDTKLEYVIYTKNETDKDGNTTVYVSRVDRSSGEPKLMGIDDDNEWNRIREVLKELSDSDVNLDNPTIGDDGLEIM